MAKHKKHKKGSFDTPEYRKLVGDIRKIIDEAAARGVDITKRSDILSCCHCGAYEDETYEGERIICSRRDQRMREGEFILIDRRERSYHRGAITYYKTTYEFICTACGTQQEEIVRDWLED
ncbi:MAG: hypothetical protein KAS66_09270 [Candidatus Omnitrophica bacterium]|nr:hypothetical protein [Candidatus Omnitrophota bacterium]